MKPDILIDTDQLHFSVQSLAGLRPSRNFRNLVSLNKAADFIKAAFHKQGYVPVEQKFSVQGAEYKNIIATYGPDTAPRFIVGAHYDVAGEQPGADDNASGVAGLLAIAGLFREHAPVLEFCIEFVAYTLEEPPFFKTEDMGSFVHARSLMEEKAGVLGMACLEMLGYYSDAPQSQFYPLSLMRFFYPDKGNFIGVVGNFHSSRLVRHFTNQMKLTAVEVKSLKAPSFIVGVDFSDHMNYWKFGYPAIMITDTAFYRNPYYHSVHDEAETLDFGKMAEVIKGVYLALINLKKRY
jgi:Zn-dependent M28 family amino/carboxypeptidase